MSDGGRRAGDVEPPDPLLDRAITNRRALVLAQVLEPGLDHEAFDVTPVVSRILVDSPRDGAVAAANRLQVADGFHKGIRLKGIDAVFVIAEEFPKGEPVRLEHLVDIVEAAMLKRIAHDRPFGVAVLAEGIALRLAEADLRAAMPEVEVDEHGHIGLGELNLDEVLAHRVKARFKARGQKVTVTAKNIGYELRCAAPIPFDVEYTRDLGYGAIHYLRELRRAGRPEIGAMITIQENHMVPLAFGSFTDPATGRPRVREVDIHSGSYRVATEYMIRLEREDLEDPTKLGPIAAAARMSPEAFRARYGYLVQPPRDDRIRQATARLASGVRPR
jgi:ATP-dependent phosphofructokinase / diphosphate-dependent phosphofructokinase